MLSENMKKQFLLLQLPFQSIELSFPSPPPRPFLGKKHTISAIDREREREGR
jgi:hypothetical protein